MRPSDPTYPGPIWAGGLHRRVGWNFTEVQTEKGPVVFLPNSSLTSTTTRNRTASGHRQVGDASRNWSTARAFARKPPA